MSNSTSIRERIAEFLILKGISRYRFYKDTGLSNGFLDKPGSINSDNCEKICYCYTDINPEWLLTGKGDKYGERAIPSHFFSRAKYDRWLMFRFIREFHANLHILEGLDSNTIANIFTNLYEQYAIEQEDIREETKNNSYINWKSSSQIEEDMKFYRKIYKK